MFYKITWLYGVIPHILMDSLLYARPCSGDTAVSSIPNVLKGLFSNLLCIRNHLEGLLNKAQMAGPHPQSYWFTGSGMGPKNLHLPARSGWRFWSQDPHIENNCSTYLLFPLPFNNKMSLEGGGGKLKFSTDLPLLAASCMGDARSLSGWGLAPCCRSKFTQSRLPLTQALNKGVCQSVVTPFT